MVHDSSTKLFYFYLHVRIAASAVLELEAIFVLLPLVLEEVEGGVVRSVASNVLRKVVVVGRSIVCWLVGVLLRCVTYGSYLNYWHSVEFLA